MKAVLISIQPKWCELIASGKKTVEVRKTRPKLEIPFKVYIYCTNGKPILGRCLNDNSLKETPESDFDNYNRDTLFRANGKVIGEFVCDRVDEFRVFENKSLQYWHFRKLENSCLSYEEVGDYIGANKNGYAWHISNLVIYDKPKELSEFITFCPEWEKEYFGTKCLHCKYYFSNCSDMRHECTVEGEKPLTKPPQSWCFVEELVGDNNA